jgi:8-oxo-dGTP diphosphatase
MPVGRFTFCVAAVIENQADEILLLKRAPDNFPGNIWDVVGGRKEPFEDPFEALLREIRQETGLVAFDIYKAINAFHWFQEDSSKAMIGVSFWCKTSTTDIRLSDEHSAFAWVTLERALTMVEHSVVTGILTAFAEEKSRLTK